MLFAAVAVFGLSVATAASSSAAKAKPECVDKCWTNSQYVSLCMGDHQCLCDDSEFQNAVYQCLYSQCSTSKFGTALHHALQACHVQEQPETEDAVFDMETPAMVIQVDDSLKRRGAKSVSASHSATRSATKSVSASKSASAYPTGRARPEHSVSVSHSKSIVRPVRSVTKSAHSSATHSAKPARSVTKSAHHSKSVSHSATHSAKPSRSVTKSAHHSASHSVKPSKSVHKSKSMTKSAKPSKSVTKSAHKSASVTRSATRSATKSASGSAMRRV